MGKRQNDTPSGWQCRFLLRQGYSHDHGPGSDLSHSVNFWIVISWMHRSANRAIDFFTAIITLCVKVVEVGQRCGMKHLWSSVINPFETEMKSSLDAIDSQLKHVHIQTRLASQQAADEERRLADSERKSNEAFRLSSFTFRKEVRRGQEAAQLRRLAKDKGKLRRAIAEQLSSVDHLKPWKQAQRRRMPSTAEWFRTSPYFEKWRQGNKSAILWCPGFMGAGKTVFASNVIAHLFSTHQNHEVVAHYMCQSDLQKSLLALEIIGSVAL